MWSNRRIRSRRIEDTPLRLSVHTTGWVGRKLYSNWQLAYIHGCVSNSHGEWVHGLQFRKMARLQKTVHTEVSVCHGRSNSIPVQGTNWGSSLGTLTCTNCGRSFPIAWFLTCLGNIEVSRSASWIRMRVALKGFAHAYKVAIIQAGNLISLRKMETETPLLLVWLATVEL